MSHENRLVTGNRMARLGVLACLALLVVSSAATDAQAAPSAVTTELSGPEISQVRDFWTPARMRGARPLSVQPGRPSRLVGASTAAGSESPHRYPPRAPSRPSLISSVTETVPDPVAAGLARYGAIFMVLPNGGGTVRCSGTSVNAPSFSLVITAGHCVNEGGRGFARKWVFVPGYRYGERPFGTFVAHWLGTTPQWSAQENFNFDVGAAVVSRNERGQRLADAVGASGIAWGLSPDQVFDVYGYSASAPFDGATLQLCSQTRFEGHGFPSFFNPGPLDLGVECRATPGSSGGGWIIAGDLLNSVTSNGPLDEPITNFGPYFGKAVERLFARAARVK